MEINIEAKRLKEVRENLGLTQKMFATELNLSTTVDIERGRTKMPGHIVMLLLKKYQINPLWLYGESNQKYLDANHIDITPKAITVDNTGEENILMVNQKAAAGYAQNIGDAEYIEALPSFTFPLPEYRNATYRGFQVEGHSMLPIIMPGEWIICKALTNINEIKSENIYVVVENQSVRIKKVVPNHNHNSLTLISTNPEYPNNIVPFHEIKEIWEFHSKLTKETEPIITQNTILNQIKNDINSIKELLK